MSASVESGCQKTPSRLMVSSRTTWYEPRATHTANEHHLLIQPVNSTIEDVCQKEDTAVQSLAWGIPLNMVTTPAIPREPPAIQHPAAL